LSRVKIKWMRSEKAWGYAVPDRSEIHLDRRLDDKLLLEIASHETIHVLFPYLTEDAVDGAGKTLADVLWRLKFRRTHEDD